MGALAVRWGRRRSEESLKRLDDEEGGGEERSVMWTFRRGIRCERVGMGRIGIEIEVPVGEREGWVWILGMRVVLV